VFFTIDTEFSPRSRFDLGALGAWIARDLDGRTSKGDFGVAYQLDELDRHGLKGVFFVEALHATSMGFDALRRVTTQILARGHDVQLHVHSEWRPKSIRPKAGMKGDRLSDFDEASQRSMVAEGLENLRLAGARRIVAFRAGHYAADRATLRAVASNGLVFDSSYDRPLLEPSTDLPWEPPLMQPTRLEGVIECPISFFRHLPGRYRHAQLCAVSSEEMTAALNDAQKRGFRSFVIVSHSFELVSRRGDDPTVAAPRKLVIKRFRGVCEFLAKHRDRFHTATFSEADPAALLGSPHGAPLRSSLRRTLNRYVQQITGLGS
jgi:hypothetical protein